MKITTKSAMALIAMGICLSPVYASLESQQQGPVSFVSGGVGEDELQQIKTLAPEYPVQLMFVTQGTPAEYLSNVKVHVTDKNGKTVLDTTADGPYLLAKMPAGTYKVSADNDGAVKQQTLQVSGNKAQRLTFVWNK